MDAKKLIKDLGGVREVANICHVPENAVYMWRFRNHIPEYRLQLLRLVKPDAPCWQENKQKEDSHAETPL
jgi:hypothetical protein